MRSVLIPAFVLIGACCYQALPASFHTVPAHEARTVVGGDCVGAGPSVSLCTPAPCVLGGKGEMSVGRPGGSGPYNVVARTCPCDPNGTCGTYQIVAGTCSSS